MIGGFGDVQVVHTTLELGFWLLVVQAVVLLAAAYVRARIKPALTVASLSAVSV